MTESVVALNDLGDGVIQLTMQDRANKNTFSPELVSGLIEAFDTISADHAYRAVVLTGYDTYFASGGTKAALLSFQAGKVNFTDRNFYRLALDCEIPVIAAMQGHAIGGGFIFGLFSDIVVLARESVYTANFMKYGFTPGMGATLVLPTKMGFALAEEVLLTAKTYRGADFERRGVPFSVTSRPTVLPTALELAREVAEKPRASLVALKRHMVAKLREQLPQWIENEVGMHEQTFHLPEVKDRITALFGK